jgi:hypothetical protein
METTNIKYTEAALDQLEKFKVSQAKKLEELIIETKKFPGVDFIEITGADVQETSKNFRHVRTKQQDSIRTYILYMYFITGVILIGFGFFYNQIQYIWYNNPKQLIIIAMGVVMVILSFLLSKYTKYIDFKNEQRRKHITLLEDANFEELSRHIKMTEKGNQKTLDKD